VTGNISSSAITLNSGATIAAGTAATVSKVNAAALTVAGNTGYIFTIGNISGGTVGTAGTDYDQIATTGAITFNNTAANPFTVYINGTPTNWNSSASYTWNILSGASISGFTSANFSADISGFGGAMAGGASWTFGASGGNLTLTYGTSGTPTWAGGTGVWSGNFTPGLNNNSGLFFSGAGGNAINDIGNGTLSSIGTITFDSAAGAYTLAANSGSAGNGTALSLAGSIINNSNSTQTINTALSVAGTRTVNTAGGNVTIGGVISGTGGLTKAGNSTLTLSGANTYNGTTTLNAGQLHLNSATALGNSTLTITGGTIDNTSSGSITLSNTNAQNWNGDFSFNGTRDLNMGAGAVTMNASRTVTVNSGNFTIGGAISGSGFGLTKNGSGSLILNGANTYTGTTTVNAGTLSIGASQTLGAIAGSGNLSLGSGFTLTTNSSSSTTYSGVISGAGGLTKAGTSTLTLSGNNTHTGATTVIAGTLNLTGSLNGTLTTGSSGTVTVGVGARVANATFTAGSVNATNALTVTNSVTLGGGMRAAMSGASSFTVQGANLTNSAESNTLTLAGGTLTLQGPPSVTGLNFFQITSDATSGISSSNTYTHAVDFNNSGTTINGVAFGNDMNNSAGGRTNSGTRAYAIHATGGAP